MTRFILRNWQRVVTPIGLLVVIAIISISIPLLFPGLQMYPNTGAGWTGWPISSRASTRRQKTSGTVEPLFKRGFRKVPYMIPN
jgi:hypothetical protein